MLLPVQLLLQLGSSSWSMGERSWHDEMAVIELKNCDALQGEHWKLKGAYCCLHDLPRPEPSGKVWRRCFWDAHIQMADALASSP